MPMLAELDEVLSSRWAQLATPAELRAARKARAGVAAAEAAIKNAIAQAKAAMLEARELCEAVAAMGDDPDDDQQK